MRDARDVILRPVVSEKSYGLLETNVYTFVVAPDASKPEITARSSRSSAYRHR